MSKPAANSVHQDDEIFYSEKGVRLMKVRTNVKAGGDQGTPA
jgi:hypothetical protein